MDVSTGANRITVVTALWAGLTLAAGAAVADSARPDANVSRWARGTIAYQVRSSGHVNGYERWRLDVHPDGSKTVAATVRYDPRPVFRHVVHRVNADGMPLDTFASYWIDGAWRGNAWYVLEGDRWLGRILSPNGTLTHVVTPAGPFAMVPHVLAVDSWRARLFNKVQGGIQGILAYNVDATALGSAALVGRLMRYNLEYLGEEPVVVPAGTFETEHYRIEGAVDLYLFGPDTLVAKFVYPAIDREHVLIEYESGGKAPADERVP